MPILVTGSTASLPYTSYTTPAPPPAAVAASALTSTSTTTAGAATTTGGAGAGIGDAIERAKQAAAALSRSLLLAGQGAAQATQSSGQATLTQKYQNYTLYC